MQKDLSTPRLASLIELDKNQANNLVQSLKSKLQLALNKSHWAEGPPHEMLFYSASAISVPKDTLSCLSEAGMLRQHPHHVKMTSDGSMELLCTGAARSKKQAEYLVTLDVLLQFQELGVNTDKPPDLYAMAKEQEKQRRQNLIQKAQMLLELCNTSRPKFTLQEHGGKGRRGGATFTATISFYCRRRLVEVEGPEAISKAEAQGNATIEAVFNHLPRIVGQEYLDKYTALIESSPGGHVTNLRIPRLPHDHLDALQAALGGDEEKAERLEHLEQLRKAHMEEMASRQDSRRKAREKRSERFLNMKHHNERMIQQELVRLRRAEAHPESPIGKMKQIRDALPIKAIRESVIEALKTEPVVVVSGGTGSGKSTQVPQYILEDAIMNGKASETRIVVTQPRRIAAISVAERIAAERDEKIGHSVGYSVRFQRQPPRFSGGSIEFVTTGILLRRMLNDDLLDDISHVVIDEVHERDIDTDFLLVLLRELVDKRPDLRVILMSATLDAESFAAYFSRRTGYTGNPVPTMSVPAKPRHPVEIIHLEDLAGESIDTSEGSAWPSELKSLSMSLLECHDRQLQRELIEADAEEDAAQNLEDRAISEDFGGISLSDSDSDDETKEVPSTYDIDDWNPSRVSMLRKAVETRSASMGSDISLDPSTSARADNKEMSEVTVALIAKLAQHLAKVEIRNGRKGSILCFLPGWDEIKEAMSILEESSDNALLQKMTLLPLHSTIPQDDQQKVFVPAKDGTVKVILATNIAESSVTIDDVLVVVDSGLVRELNYDPQNVMSLMETVPISRASATQRLGRAGRVAPGKCYRLYSRGALEAMYERPAPEIQRTALEATCLQICSMTDRGVSSFLQSAMDPPKEESVQHAMDRLISLDAITVDDESRTESLTPLGRVLARLPLEPGTGRMLVMACVMKCLDPILTLTALQSSRDVFYTPLEQREEQREARKNLCDVSDVMSGIMAFNKFHSLVREEGWDSAKAWAYDNFVSISAMNSIQSIRSQLLSDLSRVGLVAEEDLMGRRRSPVLVSDAEVNRNAGSNYLQVALWASGLPDCLASRRQLGHFGTLRTRMENHAGLHPSSVLFHRKPPQDRTVKLPDWFLYREMIQSSQVFLRGNTTIEPEQIALFGGYTMDTAAIGDGTGLNTKPARLIDDWIILDGPCEKSIETLVDVRREIQSAIQLKVMDPQSPLPESYQKVLDATCDLYQTLGAETEKTEEMEREDAFYSRFAESESSDQGNTESDSDQKILERHRQLMRDFLGVGIAK